MSETWPLIAGLALGTFAIRLGGFLLGARLPRRGAWARAFEALPGALIAALVSVLLLEARTAERLAAAIALLVAAATRSLPLTMLAGIGAVLMLRATLYAASAPL